MTNKGDQKMVFSRIKGVAVVCCFVAVCALLFSGPAAAQTSKSLSTITIPQGDLTGVVFNALGKQLADMAVSVRNTAGKVVATATSGKKGGYTIKDLKEGKYSVYVGNLKVVAVKVTKGSRMSTLKIVTPSGGAMSSTGSGGKNPPKKTGRYLFTTIKLNNSYYTIGAPAAKPGIGDPQTPPGNVSP